MAKKIFYWGPFIDENIATKKAILNSATAINKYSKDYMGSKIRGNRNNSVIGTCFLF